MTTYDGLRYGHATIADLDRLTTYHHVTRFNVWVTATRVAHDDDSGDGEHGWLDGYWGVVSRDMWRDLHESRNYVDPVLTVTMSDVDPDLEGYETFRAAVLSEWRDLTHRLDALTGNGDGSYYCDSDTSEPSDDYTQTFALHVEVVGAFNPAAPIRNKTEPVTIIDLPTN